MPHTASAPADHACRVRVWRRYALLKSNQVDEASMTDLSRLVFKIIPYDKSEVIQMMYKLLYLESQLEGHQ